MRDEAVRGEGWLASLDSLGAAGLALPQEKEMEKQRLLYQQARLHNRGAAEMVLQMISACKGALVQALLPSTRILSPFPGDPAAPSPTPHACALHTSAHTFHLPRDVSPVPCPGMLLPPPPPLLPHTLGWLFSGGWRTVLSN